MNIFIENRKTFRKNGILAVFSVLMAVIFVLLFSYSTSPLYRMYANSDSAIFQTIGAFWAKGRLPYVELWDHKGPLIFAIDAIGYRIGERHGILIIQIISMSITNIFLFKLAKIKFSTPKAMLVVLLFLVKLILNYEEGNYTEEYMLPFIAASIYGMYMWGSGTERSHSARWAFVYGAGVGACLLTRITNAVPILGGTCFILYELVKYRKLRNIVRNAIFFALGLMIMVMPFVVYFWIQGALSEMWYGMIGYNLTYVQHVGLNLSSKPLLEIVRIFVAYFCSMGLCIISLILILCGIKKNRRNKQDYLWLVIAGCMCFLFLSGNGYLHYGIIEGPLVIISALRIDTLKNCIYESSAYLERVAKMAIIGGVFFCTISGFWGIKRVMGACQKHDAREYHIAILDNIPQAERDSFIAWHCPNWIYLKEDIVPCYKYFTQTSHTSWCAEP